MGTYIPMFITLLLSCSYMYVRTSVSVGIHLDLLWLKCKQPLARVGISLPSASKQQEVLDNGFQLCPGLLTCLRTCQFFVWRNRSTRGSGLLNPFLRSMEAKDHKMTKTNFTSSDRFVRLNNKSFHRGCELLPG